MVVATAGKLDRARRRLTATKTTTDSTAIAERAPDVGAGVDAGCDDGLAVDWVTGGLFRLGFPYG